MIGGDQASRLRELVAGKPTGTVSSPGRGARILVVTSGKGGVGKTNLTLNLALALAKRGQRTLLFDADLGMANVDVLLNLSPRFTIADVIAGRKSVSEVVIPVGQNFEVVPGGSGIAQLASLEPKVLEEAVGQLSELEGRADLLLVDTGAGISPNVLGFVLAAPEVLVVTTPEPTAIVDAYGIIKTLASRNRTAKVSLVVNMVESEAEARSVFQKVNGIIERFLSLKVSQLGWIEKDSNVGRSVLQQQPFLNAYPYTLATRRVHMIAGAILAKDAASSIALQEGFFERLGRLLFPGR